MTQLIDLNGHPGWERNLRPIESFLVARTPSGVEMTLAEIEQVEVMWLKQGEWFITVTADESLEQQEVVTGWVEYQSAGATCVKLNRTRDNSFWIAKSTKVLPIENPFGEEQKLVEERNNNMALGKVAAAEEVADAVEQELAEQPVESITLGDDDTREVPAEELASVEVATVNTVDPNVESALRKRYEFWKQKLADASDEAMLESAMTALERIEKEALSKGVNVKVNSAPKAAANVAGKIASGKVPKSVKEKEALADRKAKVLAETKAKPAGQAKAKVAAAPKKEKVLRPCLDGCGAMVAGNFQMGHDAKLKSLLLKIERGEETTEAVPEICAGIVKFKKGELEVIKNAKGETTGKVQHMICTAAPVKFQGRTDMTITQREA